MTLNVKKELNLVQQKLQKTTKQNRKIWLCNYEVVFVLYDGYIHTVWMVESYIYSATFFVTCKKSNVSQAFFILYICILKKKCVCLLGYNGLGLTIFLADKTCGNLGS